MELNKEEITFGEFMGGVAVFVLVYSFLGGILGVLSTIDARMNTQKDGCVYRSVAAYINPGYYGVCELFRARFNIDQPVQYVPAPTKELGTDSNASAAEGSPNPSKII